MSTLDLGPRSSFTIRCYRSSWLSWSDKSSLEARQWEWQDAFARDFTVFTSFATQARVLQAAQSFCFHLLGAYDGIWLSEQHALVGFNNQRRLGILDITCASECLYVLVNKFAGWLLDLLILSIAIERAWGFDLVKVDRSVGSLFLCLELSCCVCAFRLTRSSQVGSKLCKKHYPTIGMPVTPTTTSTISTGKLWQYWGGQTLGIMPSTIAARKLTATENLYVIPRIFCSFMYIKGKYDLE